MLKRRKLVADLLVNRPENLLIVTGLGSPTYDVAAAGDHPLNFYLWGAMGGAVPMGLGLALSQPDKRVLVITGDGECLMGLGAFATVGTSRPENLAVLVLDNQAYGETGGQSSHTGQDQAGGGIALEKVCQACNFSQGGRITQENEIDELKLLLFTAPGPVLAVAEIDRTEDPRVLPSRDGFFLRQRFRKALLDLEP